MRSRLLFLIFIAVTVSTCTYDAANPEICFQEDILPIFVTKCSMSGCHDPIDKKEEYVLNSYEGIMKGIRPKHPLQSEIYNVIKGNNPAMPVGQKLDPREVAYIKVWIKTGAPNSSNCNPCDTSDYTYSGRIKPLLTTWCVGCHNSGSSGGGYDLSSYSGIVPAISNNSLVATLEHTAGFSPMPQNAGKLSACDISAVKKWIADGYPDN